MYLCVHRVQCMKKQRGFRNIVLLFEISIHNDAWNQNDASWNDNTLQKFTIKLAPNKFVAYVFTSKAYLIFV